MIPIWFFAGIGVALLLMRYLAYARLRKYGVNEEDFRIINIRGDHGKLKVWVADKGGAPRYVSISVATSVWVAVDPACREVSLRVPRTEKSCCTHESAKIVVPDKALESEWIRQLNDARQGGVA